jgi:RND superfamily putative drug exporter
VLGTLSMQDFKQLGVGLAAAILLDATIVRGVLLPSVLSLLGERTWYLPRWLSWLPQHLSAEAITTAAAAGPPADRSGSPRPPVPERGGVQAHPAR